MAAAVSVHRFPGSGRGTVGPPRSKPLAFYSLRSDRVRLSVKGKPRPVARPTASTRGARAGSIRTKRAYERPLATDGKRILIDHIWPRGLTKSAVRLDDWRKELAPSGELRKWFDHDPAKFARFRTLYRKELLRCPDALATLIVEVEHGPVTLVYAAKDSEHCNATVLQELVREIARAQ